MQRYPADAVATKCLDEPFARVGSRQDSPGIVAAAVDTEVEAAVAAVAVSSAAAEAANTGVAVDTEAVPWPAVIA